MSKLSIQDPLIAPSLQSEIRRNNEARYNHRLHVLLLIANGLSCQEAAKLMGDSPRTVQYWVSRFEQNGFRGILEQDHPGRPRRLTEAQEKEISLVLDATPDKVDLPGTSWNGILLSAYIKRIYNVKLAVRQCQRLIRALKSRI